MRAHRDVVSPPALDDDLCLGERVEDLTIKQFIPQPGIERLDKAALPWAARRDVGGLRPNRRDPCLNRKCPPLQQVLQGAQRKNARLGLRPPQAIQFDRLRSVMAGRVATTHVLGQKREGPRHKREEDRCMAWPCASVRMGIASPLAPLRQTGHRACHLVIVPGAARLVFGRIAVLRREPPGVAGPVHRIGTAALPAGAERLPALRERPAGIRTRLEVEGHARESAFGAYLEGLVEAADACLDVEMRPRVGLEVVHARAKMIDQLRANARGQASS